MKTWQDVRLKFTQYLKDTVHLANNTIYGYTKDLDMLCLFAENNLQLRDITHICRKPVIRQYILYQMRLKKSPISVRRYLMSIRRFCAWYAQYSQDIDPNPVDMHTVPKAHRNLPSVPDPDTLMYLLDAQPRSYQEIRDLAIFECLYGSGLRVSEVITLKKSDIMDDDMLIKVTGKGSHDRIVPIGKKSFIALQQYIKLRDNNTDISSLWLFDNPKTGGHISARNVQYRLRRWSMHTIGRPLNPHILRHAYATHLLQSGMHIRAIQELLGHRSIMSTQIYIRLDFQQLAAVYDRHHPRSDKDAARPHKPSIS